MFHFNFSSKDKRSLLYYVQKGGDCMPFDGITIHALTDEIKAIIVGSRIDKIHQPENDEIVFHIRHDRTNYKLLLSADSNLPYFGMIDVKKENPVIAPMFCMLLRKHIAGGRVIDFEQLELERVIILTVESRTELGDLTIKKIIFEIMGKHSNITLVDEDYKIIDCIKRIALGVNRYRQLFPGITYLYPPNDKIDPRIEVEENFIKMIHKSESRPTFKHIYMTYQGISPIISKEFCLQANIDFTRNQDTLTDGEINELYKQFDSFFSDYDQKIFKNQIIYLKNQALKDLTIVELSPYQSDEFEIKYFDTTIEIVNEYYANKNSVNKLLQRSQNLRKTIQGKIVRQKKKIQNLKEDLMFADKADTYKIKGELILANIYKIEKGMKKIVVDNFYDNNTPITINLDYQLSPSDNAQRLFKRYSKFKTAQIKVQEQLGYTEDEIKYLEHVLHNIEQSPDQNNFEEIKEELILTGYLRDKQKGKKKKKIKNEPFHYLSSDGFEILAGKNNLQNDVITLKVASKSDVWFHTKNIPGSHVIVRAYGKKVPEQTLKEAAMIAAYHSKAKESSQVPVDYTDVRYLKKPNGAKPGMVIFSRNSTMYVTPIVSEIMKLVKK